MSDKLNRTTCIWRCALLSAALLAAYMAFLPQPPRLPGDPPDIALHALAFAALTGLTRQAYPTAKAWQILAGLGAFGASIELVQAIPSLERDASMVDWLADIFAICAMLAAFKLTSRI